MGLMPVSIYGGGCLRMAVHSELLNALEEKRMEYKINVSAKGITTFKAGGSIDICILPKNKSELVFAALVAHRLGEKFTVLGRGSNTLFSDDGYRGVVILTEGLHTVVLELDDEGGSLCAECGVPLTYLTAFAAKQSLSGLEFAYGIPGSCGGAVYMNAGAYGGQMSDIVESSEYLDLDSGQILTLEKGEHGFDYRRSVYSDSDGKMILLSVHMRLQYGDRDVINQKMQANMQARKEKQPLEYPNAGSVFKRHPGFYMGQIIEESGLKGFRIGGAEVSEKHAGFIINKDGATASDIRSVISYISDVISDKYGFTPECEIRMID